MTERVTLMGLSRWMEKSEGLRTVQLFFSRKKYRVADVALASRLQVAP